MDLDKKEEDEKIGQGQIYDIITSKNPSWQQVIYDLISSEQLDPWDVDLTLLSLKYFEKIEELETEGFFISSKLLLAASLLLRIKSEMLLDKYLRSIDEILFGKKEEVRYISERIELDENELPLLIPKTPLPRFKQVTLTELMSALNKAINTESRRIEKEIEVKQAERLSYVDVPKARRVSVQDRVRQIYAKIQTYFSKNKEKLSYSDLVGSDREERIACFLPILHLSNRKKLWLEQEKHFDEIFILLYTEYSKLGREDLLDELREEIEEVEEEIKEDLDNFNYDKIISL